MIGVIDDVEAEETTNWVQRAENGSMEDEDIALIAYEDGEVIEQHFALAAFLFKSNLCHG